MLKTLDLKNGVIKLPIEIQKKISGSQAVLQDDQLVIRIEIPKKQKQITGEERRKIWESVRGMWKDRQPDPIEELNEMRSQWDRDLPNLKSLSDE